MLNNYSCNPKNNEKAFQSYMKAASDGDCDKIFVVGLCYSAGKGVEIDKFQAVKYFKKATENNHIEAQFLLGLSYYIGDGLKRDEIKSIKWSWNAAKGGHEPALRYLSVITGKEFPENGMNLIGFLDSTREIWDDNFKGNKKGLFSFIGNYWDNLGTSWADRMYNKLVNRVSNERESPERIKLEEIALSLGVSKRTLDCTPKRYLKKLISTIEYSIDLKQKIIQSLLFEKTKHEEKNREILIDKTINQSYEYFYSICDSEPETILLEALIRLGKLNPQGKCLVGEVNICVQEQINSYRVDFLANNKFVIEVDGKQYHGTESAFYKDRYRDQDLIMSGYTVIRFPAKQIYLDADSVAENIIRIATNLQP